MGLMPGVAASITSGQDVVDLLEEIARNPQFARDPDGLHTERMGAVNDLIRGGKKAEVVEAAGLMADTLTRGSLVVIDIAQEYGRQFALDLGDPLETIKAKLADPANNDLDHIPQGLQHGHYVDLVDRALAAL